MKSGSTPTETERNAVARACRALVVADVLSGILGHASVRHGDRDLLIRCRGPRERGLRYTTGHDIHRVGLDGTPPDDGAYSAPNELPIHTAVMAARDDVGAVVHAHPPAALLAGLAELDLPAMFGAYNIPAARLAADGIPVYPRAVLINDQELAGELVESLGSAKVCILRGHGIVTTGASLAEAVVAAVDLEALARVAVELHRLGAPPRAIADADFAQLPDLGGGFNDEQIYRHLLANLDADDRLLGIEGDGSTGDGP